MRDIRSTLDRKAFNRVCTMREREFGERYGMSVTLIDQPAPENYYFYKDNGSSVLAVAHLDTVVGPDQREARFVETAEAGEVVFSGALDDRLGAYIILEWLPAMGIEYDILLTVGEESGMSTAGGFWPDKGKDYDWIIEFDRGGTDVVMYQYEDETTREAVRKSGARVGDGIFSDISYLEHLEVKAFNWGVGYRDYHSTRGHAYLEDTYMMLDYYLAFHEQNLGRYMPHEYGAIDLDDIYAREDCEPWLWDENGRAVDRSWYDDETDPTDEDIYAQPDALDDDWIEYPTQAQLRALAEAEAAWDAARLSRFDR